jgi:6-phosphogluconolactonase/glucosamine-6-phosphate isomerase/deaminase
MQFINQVLPDKSAREFRLQLQDELELGKKILWLISTEATIPIIVQIMNELPADLTDQLTIIPTDERYGHVGHKDSTVKQLLDAGFEPKHAYFFAPLSNNSLETTLKNYVQAFQAALNNTDITVALLGVGADGRIAGILPRSEALRAQNQITTYKGSDYIRITLTISALMEIDQAYVFAYGRNKHATLDRLCDGDIRLADQPAQVLRELREVYIYNDQLDNRNA